MIAIAVLCSFLAGPEELGAGLAPPTDVMRIGAVQGRGDRSPQLGRRVQVIGIVTAHAADGRSFWIQDPVGDGDPASSEGIRVDAELPRPVAVGDRLRVEATVAEPDHRGALSVTALVDARVQVLGRGEALPAPTPLRLPTESLPEARRWWEAHEGMRVAVADATAVAPTDKYEEFVVIAGEHARPGSGYQPRRGVIRLRALDEGGVDYNPERIMVRCAGDRVPLAPLVEVGDHFDLLVGVVDYSYSNYKLIPTELRHRPGARRAADREDASRAPDELRIASFNVENLFDLADDPQHDDAGTTLSPEDQATQLGKLALCIDEVLGRPDVLIVQEVENQAVLAELGRRVQAMSGVAYEAATHGSSDVRGIENGFLWRTDRVRMKQSFLLDTPAVRAAFGAGSSNPGREPVVGFFEFAGRELILVGNHLKSKWGDEALFGAAWPPARRSEEPRRRQARALRAWLDERLGAEPEALVLVAGDFNDFPFPEPDEGDDPLGLIRADGGRGALEDLLLRVPERERFTYLYQGNAQILDHALASAALAARVQDVWIHHLNSLAPARFRGMPHVARRCSDHDPVVVRLRFPPLDPRPSVDSRPKDL